MAENFAPSLFDKLLGHAEDRLSGVMPRFSAKDMKDSVAADIEDVMNSHASYSPEELAAFPLAARSYLTLGLSDVSSLSTASDRDRGALAETIRYTLTQHDKRLSQVEVQVRQDKSAAGGLGFSIRARLQLQPGAEPALFDAVLQPGSLRCVVEGAGSRAGSNAAKPVAAAAAPDDRNPAAAPSNRHA